MDGIYHVIRKKVYNKNYTCRCCVSTAAPGRQAAEAGGSKFGVE